MVEQGLTSHSTQFRSFRIRCFYRSDDPTNWSTEGGWL